MLFRSFAVQITLGIMKFALITLAAGLLLAGCGSDHALLRAHANEWRVALDASVPQGTSVEKAKAWGERKGISFTFLEPQHELHAVAERMPETGVNKFVCSEWSILLIVSFSSSGLSEKNEVKTLGTCL